VGGEALRRQGVQDREHFPRAGCDGAFSDCRQRRDGYEARTFKSIALTIACQVQRGAYGTASTVDHDCS
jgi:hypothetical protein